MKSCIFKYYNVLKQNLTLKRIEIENSLVLILTFRLPYSLKLNYDLKQPVNTFFHVVYCT